MNRSHRNSNPALYTSGRFKSMFHPNISTPYEAKLINFTYPIFAGANFGPSEEDIEKSSKKVLWKELNQ